MSFAYTIVKFPSCLTTPHYRDYRKHQTSSMANPLDLQKHGQICNEASQIAVVIVPYLEQGHLNPLLNLSRLLSSYNIPIYFLGTSTSNRQAKFRVCGWDILDFPTIQFHDLVPSSSSSTLTNSSGESIMEKKGSFFTSILLLREPIRDFLREISSTYRRTVVINDSGMSWVVQDAVSLPKTECYCFHSISVFTALSFAWETTRKPVPSPEAEIIAELPPRENTFDSETLEYIKLQREARDFYSIGLHNSCKEIEGVFIDLLEKQRENKQWAIGPLNPVEISKKKAGLDKKDDLFSWLDKQDLNSVIYVSFGSTTTLSNEQIKELALGLEQSGQKFIWVLREADKKGGDNVKKGSNFELPKGYEERIKGKGYIEKDWAPQLEILAHQSIGGFMSHCGWNSCIESISMGVPIAAWPIHSDQPRNTVLMTEVLKIGIVVRDWENRHELVSAVKIENAVRNLMDSAEGEELRRRVAELSGAVKKSVKNGASRKEVDSFVAHITR
ncbi:zeatin O-xylosyltransferase-like [Nicotiana tomentosiformis]|uniref:zeatin O-xylosyltransferase-like n=1 Tax=Nicotiana tomentosiformis TaxID=4098 RepID=UPI00388C9E90